MSRTQSGLPGIYNSTALTLANGDGVALAVSSSGILYTTTAPLTPATAGSGSPSLYAPLTQVTKANIKATAGNVFSILITSINASVRYFQLHNKATAPAAADVPLVSIPIPAGAAAQPTELILDSAFFTVNGEAFSTGIGWAVSTTFATFTDSATATDHIVVVHYI